MGSRYIHHTCNVCGTNDLLPNVAIGPYVCVHCAKAQQCADFMSNLTPRGIRGRMGLQWWQVVALSRWLRSEAQ